MLDTLKYSHQLEAAGVTREQAEAQAEALREALDQGDLATKADLTATKADLTTEIRELETRLTTRMYALQGATIAILFGLLKFFG